MLFHIKSGYANALQFYVICTLPVLLYKTGSFKGGKVIKSGHLRRFCQYNVLFCLFSDISKGAACLFLSVQEYVYVPFHHNLCKSASISVLL